MFVSLKHLSSEKAAAYFHRFVVPLCGRQSLFCFLHCHSYSPYFLYNVFSVFEHQWSGFTLLGAPAAGDLP